jgi:hypothetical protein
MEVPSERGKMRAHARSELERSNRGAHQRYASERDPPYKPQRPHAGLARPW